MVNLAYCVGASASALTATGSNLLWYAAAMGGTGSTTAPTPTTTAAGMQEFWVTQTVNSCESDRAKIVVTITAIPAAPTISNLAYCVGASASALTATGSNLLWYAAAMGGTGSTTAPTPTTTTAGMQEFWVTQTVNSCESDRAKIVVTITAIPAAPTISNLTYCTGESASALTATGSNLLWYAAAMGGTGSTTAPTPTTTAAGMQEYWVTQTVNSCESDRAKIVVTIIAAPAAPTISNLTYCTGASASALTATGSNLLWYAAPMGGTGSTTAPTPTTTAAGMQEYWVTQTVNSCESDRAKIVVTIDDLSVGGALSGADSVCIGANRTDLMLSGHIGAIQKWQSDTDINFSNPTDIVNTTTTYTVEDITEKTHYRAVLENGGCPIAYSTPATIAIDMLDTDMDGIGDDCDCDGLTNVADVPLLFGTQIPTGLYKAGMELSAEGIVNTGNTVSLKAGESILLKPGFHAKSGSDLHAYIEVCVGASPFVEEDPTKDQLRLRPPTSANEGTLSLKVSPNPFMHQTKLDFKLSQEEVISIRVFDQSGRMVKQVLSPQKRAAGNHEVILTNENLYGGMFFVMLQTSKELLVKKVIVIKDGSYGGNDDD